MAVQLCQKTAAERFVHAITREMIHPDPRQGSEGDLESAGPVDPALKRILSNPVFPMLHQDIEKLTSAGEQTSLGEKHEILMTIQFPDEFVIAYPIEVEVGDRAEIRRSWKLPIMHPVAPPGDLPTEIKFDAEQRNPILYYSLSEPFNFCSERRMLQTRGHRRRVREQRERRLARWVQMRRAEQEEKVRRFLAQSKSDLSQTAHRSGGRRPNTHSAKHPTTHQRVVIGFDA